MSTFTYTTTSSDLKFGYSDDTWGYGNTAYQGNNAVSGETANSAQRIGIIVFSGAGSALKGKSISSISLKLTFGEAGSSSSSTTKTLKIYQSNYQTINTSKYDPTDYLNTNNTLGTLETKGYGNTDTFTLSSSSNSSLFSKLASYLTNGNSAIVIYNDSNPSSNSYSKAYLQITSATITVTYNELGVVYIDNGTTFEAYQVYIDNGSSWDLYAPYIDNGSSWDSCS